MANYESDQTFRQDELGLEIERALAVEPSPEFLARVRATTAVDQNRAAWSRSWVWMSVAVSAVVLMISLFNTRPKPLDLPVLRELPRTHVASTIILPAPATPSKPHEREKPARRPDPVSALATPVSTSDPEVLIAPDEAAALKRLMRGLGRRRIDPVSFAQTEKQLNGAPSAIVVSPIPKISPIAIEPLGLEEGARR